MAYSNPLKDKLRQTSDLPPGFGFDDMEEGIRKKMISPEKKRRRFFWIWFIPLVMACGSLYWLLPQSDEIHKVDKNFDNPGPETKTKKEKPTDNKVYNQSPVVSDETKVRMEFPTSDTKPSNRRNDDVVTKVDVKKVSDIVSTPDISNKKTGDQKINKQEVHKPNDILEKSEKQTSNDISQASVTVPNLISGETLKESPPSSVLQNPVFLDNPLTELISFSEAPVAPKITVVDHSAWKRNIEVGGGFLYWNMSDNFSGFITQSDHEAEIQINPLGGWLAECRVNHIFRKKYVINFGIAATTQFHSFTYEGTMTQESVSQNQQIIAIENNVLTGRVTEIYGISTQSVSTSRKVRSLNRDFFLRIPVSVGYQYKKHNWSFYAGGGGSLAVFGRQNGKTFAFNDIVAYQNRHPLQNSVNWMWELEGKVAYHISPDWNIGLSLRYFSRNRKVPFTDQNITKTYGMYPMVMVGKSF
jgi:hypothetical protein